MKNFKNVIRIIVVIVIVIVAGYFLHTFNAVGAL